MSFKVYDGLILNTGDAFEACSLINNTLQPMFHRKIVENYKIWRESAANKETYDTLRRKFSIMPEDTNFKQDNIVEKNMAAHHMSFIINKLKNSNFASISSLGIGYDISLFKNQVTDNALMLIHASDESYVKKLKSQRIVSDYGYWDNADEPDFISEKEWAERKKAWAFVDEGNWESLSITNPTNTEIFMTIYNYEVKMREG